MRRISSILALIAVLAPGIAHAGEDPGCLTEKEILRVLEGLPYEFAFRPVEFSGNGAVVAGSSSWKGGTTYFRVVSGKPEFQGKLLPKRPRSYSVGLSGPDPNRSGNDLQVRITDSRRPSEARMSIYIVDSLCAYRLAKPECPFP